MMDSIHINLWATLGHVVIKVHLPVEFHSVKAGINLYQQMSCHKRFTSRILLLQKCKITMERNDFVEFG